MNPGNGIETTKQHQELICVCAFLFMNPGNGIETTWNSRTTWKTRLSYL